MKNLLMATAATLLATSAIADVNIGNPMAMTGPIPDLNAPIAAAVDLAAANINAQGGMFADGETLNIIRADSACDPVAAVDAVTKLINVNGVTAIVGPVCSGATIAQAESVAIPAGVLTLSVSASSPAITNMEDGTDLMFRAAASDAYQGVALAELAMANGFTDIAVSYANDDYNAAIAEVFVQAYEGMGGTITANEAHEPNKASYRSEVATIGATSENLALFSYYGSGGITLMRNALETGAFTNFIGADGMLSDELIEQIGAENLMTSTFTTSASDASTPSFAAWKAIADEAGVPASDPFVANGYDATFMMALAIEAAGNDGREGLSEHLRAIASAPGEVILPGQWAEAKAILAAGGDINYEGAAGNQDFDENGDVAGNFSKSVIVDGAWAAELIQ
ncbi:putative branched-chain amino acid ABC transporter periplasmic substrate binding protein [Octadecabacter arcticus 238]|jgi:branched-chain amino acid transport system substrate-binding protein|uniref:Putative branched-chain amino acid ABC transporter periplasmic substrate binding protein n=1 Tax=Octadecabacter arcticus 238 TaxID=391616 RepID=M9RQJ2_9RHOB|nr:ABC transporter substrate-binding protein [Octadecabacter arcticus]AGI72060.1 putative branched-chain amino acid ABC transporter periplasmic substrate binding protein [Octadecabacter arcticus 238]